MLLRPNELIVDNFAGGGGASTGIEQALGRSPDIAINHDDAAIAMHEANHPRTKHYREDIWQVDPVEACAGRPVGLAWFSPDCRHFSKAKGSAPVSRKIRGLAGVVVRWARRVRPRVLVVENVEEFKTWGPLNDDYPDPERAGQFFARWLTNLGNLGYKINFGTLNAADFGAPTLRKRLFVVARCDGLWPTLPTGSRRNWKPASSIIDWTIPCRSIFGRTKPLKEATLNRIRMGVDRYVLNGEGPFVVRTGHYSTITGAGLREGCGAGLFRGQSLHAPLATVCATNDKHLVVPLITKHYGGVVGHSIERTLGTITARDHHALTQAVLSDRSEAIDRSAEVESLLGRQPILVIGETFYRVIDIQTRMLQPRELFNAQGFPADYGIAPELNGRPLNKTQQIRLAGNSVCPPIARAVIEANLRAEALAA